MLTSADKEVRAKRIGSSEVAAVLGISPYADATPFAVWARITQGYQRPDADELTAGRYLEGAVVEWYIDQFIPDDTPWVQDGIGIPHPRHDWLSATPDRLVVDHVCLQWLLECKTDRNRDAWGEPGTDQVPVHVAAQVQIAMEVTGLDRCDVAVLFKSLDQFACYTVTRDDAAIAHIIAVCGAWYARHVTGGVMPDLDGGNAASDYLRKRYPGGAPLAEATPAQVQLVAEYRGKKLLAKEYEAQAAVLRQRIAMELGDANGWNGLLTYKPNRNGVRALKLLGEKE